MLELRPFCECCAKALPPLSEEAMMCTFECTFCSTCNEFSYIKNICPNCGGNLVKRPIRPERYLQSYPPSKKRIVKGHECVEVVA